jgi:CubicO group peptidase (beta-lactamase class C family)
MHAHGQAGAFPKKATASSGPIARALRPFVDDHIMAGAVTVVATKDRVLDVEAVGYSNLKTKRLMSPNDIFWIASMSKPMTATAFLMLVDEGKASLDDPVAKYIPSFNNVVVRPSENSSDPPSKPVHPLTIRELLSHNSGMAPIAPEEKPTLDLLPLIVRVEDYAKNPLLAQPGTEFIYANSGVNTVGRIIEIVSGMPYERFMQTRLFDPLGMKNTTFYPNRRQIAHLATAYKANEAKDALEEVPITQLAQPFDDRAKRYPVPAGGLFSTAADITAFLQMIANDGVYKNRRLISDQSIRNMTTKQTSSQTKATYGLGWSISSDGIGHDGAYNTAMYIQPRTGLLSIFLVQQFPAHWPTATDGGKRVHQAFKAAVETFAKDAQPLNSHSPWSSDNGSSTLLSH